jgi:hypothetical protein
LLVVVNRELLQMNRVECPGLSEELLMMGDPQQLSILVHDRAMLNDEEILTARTYKHERQRDSCHVCVQYEQEYIAITLFFITISHSENPDRIPLRFAAVDFCEHHNAILDPDLGTIHLVKKGLLVEEERNWPVLLSSINHKVVYCTDSGGICYLVKYNINSGVY